MTDCDKARETINPQELPMRNFASALASHLNHYFASITAPTLRSTFSTQSVDSGPSLIPRRKVMIVLGGRLKRFANEPGARHVSRSAAGYRRPPARTLRYAGAAGRAHRRARRGAGTADRDRRGIAGHQFLAR